MSIKQATLFALRFMAFCEEYGIGRCVAARMCVLREKIGRLAMGESGLSVRQRNSLDRMREELVRIAKPFGMGVDCGNPVPKLLLKGGDRELQISIPSL